MQTNPFYSPWRATSSKNLPHPTIHFHALSSTHPEPHLSNKLNKLIDTQLGLAMSTLQEGNLGFLSQRMPNQGSLRKPSNLSQGFRLHHCIYHRWERTCYLLVKDQRSATRPEELITFLPELPKWNFRCPIDSCFNSKWFLRLSIRIDLAFYDATNASSNEVGHVHSTLWCN